MRAFTRQGGPHKGSYWLHYEKCRIQCFWSLTRNEDWRSGSLNLCCLICLLWVPQLYRSAIITHWGTPLRSVICWIRGDHPQSSNAFLICPLFQQKRLLTSMSLFRELWLKWQQSSALQTNAHRSGMNKGQSIKANPPFYWRTRTKTCPSALQQGTRHRPEQRVLKHLMR